MPLLDFILNRKARRIEFFSPHKLIHGKGFTKIPFGGDRKISVLPGKCRTLICGVSVHLPEDMAMMVILNPGISVTQNVVQEFPDILPPGYRGNILIRVKNNGDRVWHVSAEDTIAQLIPISCPRVEYKELSLKQVDPRRYQRIPSL